MQSKCPKTPRHLGIGAACLLLAMVSAVTLSARMHPVPVLTPEQAAQAAEAMSHLPDELKP
jgi:hypothetical protein